jgi:hypothetical protein
MRVLAQQFQDGLTRSGDLAGVLAELVGQLGEIRLRLLAAVRVLMLVMRLAALAHVVKGWFALRFLVNKRITSDTKNKPMQDMAMVAPHGASK